MVSSFLTVEDSMGIIIFFEALPLDLLRWVC